MTPPASRKRSAVSPIAISSPSRSPRRRTTCPLTHVPFPEALSTSSQPLLLCSRRRCWRETEMSEMTTAFRAARPTVTTAPTTANSLPFDGPAVTRSRALAVRLAAKGAVASTLPFAHLSAAAASASGDGPPGDVGAGGRTAEGQCCWREARRGIRFTVSLGAKVGLGRHDALLGPVPAARGIVAGIVEQHLAPGPLRPVMLPVPLEPGGDEEQPLAFAAEISLALRDEAGQLVAEGARPGCAFQMSGRGDECRPRVVEVAGSDPPLRQLPPASLVHGAGRHQIARRCPRWGLSRPARSRVALLHRDRLAGFRRADD